MQAVIAYNAAPPKSAAMQAIRHIANSYSGAAVLALVVLGLMLRASIAPGFMPQTGPTPDSEGGGLTLVICTAQGLDALPFSGDGESTPADPGQSETGLHAGDGCWFAGLAAQTSAPPPAAAALPSPCCQTPALTVKWAQHDRAALGLLRGPPLGARAPPARSLA